MESLRVTLCPPSNLLKNPESHPSIQNAPPQQLYEQKHPTKLALAPVFPLNTKERAIAVTSDNSDSLVVKVIVIVRIIVTVIVIVIVIVQERVRGIVIIASIVLVIVIVIVRIVLVMVIVIVIVIVIRIEGLQVRVARGN